MYEAMFETLLRDGGVSTANNKKEDAKLQTCESDFFYSLSPATHDLSLLSVLFDICFTFVINVLINVWIYNLYAHV